MKYTNILWDHRFRQFASMRLTQLMQFKILFQSVLNLEQTFLWRPESESNLGILRCCSCLLLPWPWHKSMHIATLQQTMHIAAAQPPVNIFSWTVGFHDLLVCGFATSTLIAFRASVPSSREPLIASPSFLSSSSLSSFPLLFLLFPFSYFSLSPSFHLLFLSPLSISPSFPPLTTTLLNFLTNVGMSTVGSYCKLTWVEWYIFHPISTPGIALEF